MDIVGFVVMSGVGLIDPVAWINFLVCRRCPGLFFAIVGGVVVGAVNYYVVALMNPLFRFSLQSLSAKMFAAFLIGLFATWISMNKKAKEKVGCDDGQLKKGDDVDGSQCCEIVPADVEAMAAYHWRNAVQYKKMGSVKEAVDSYGKAINELGPNSKYRSVVEGLLSSIQSDGQGC